MAGMKQNMAPFVEIFCVILFLVLRKMDLDEPTSFLDLENLGCTQSECKPNKVVMEERREMFESRISAGATEKLPGCEEPHAKSVAWSHNVEGHAPNALKDTANWRTKKKNKEQLYKVSSPCLDDHHFEKERNLNQSEACQKYAHKLS